MQRAQQLQCTSEIIFVDTTATCDSTSSSLTVLLTATKAGALPIADIIHENQTEEGYRRAFLLLKTTFPFCFGGKEVSNVNLLLAF